MQLTAFSGMSTKSKNVWKRKANCFFTPTLLSQDIFAYSQLNLLNRDENYCL